MAVDPIWIDDTVNQGGLSDHGKIKGARQKLADVAKLARPQRWDSPFCPDMTDADVAMVLKRPEFQAIDASRFPNHTPLAGIIRNDARIVDCLPGDILIREGDYGNSAFLILKGELRVVLAPSLPREVLGGVSTGRKGFFETLAQLWTNSRICEVRDVRQYTPQQIHNRARSAEERIFLTDVPVVLDRHRTERITSGSLFGELAALGRVPRTATIFAENEALLLEIRWQGLRELYKRDPGWRRQIDENYREYALRSHLRGTRIFADLDAATLDEVAEQTIFENYGDFDWHVSYKRSRAEGQGVGNETVISQQRDYPDGLLLIRAGFARVSVPYGNSERTLTYLGAGDFFGFDELYQGWQEKEVVPLETSLAALGYVDVLRVPTPVLEEHIFPKIAAPTTKLSDLADRPAADDQLLEWAVEERFINGTMAMLIDLDRCVRCDDCVKACASTHGGSPRFIRHGKTIDHWMVANACMHCTDPVCMIGCPTGAIHRDLQSGTVVINDLTCIGCGTCANSCPYENIRLVEIRDKHAKPIVDPDSEKPIMKATKCDLCITNPGGPACVRACPHDALRRVDFRTAIPFRKAS